MAAKFGYEAIKYVLTKVLTKKGVKGIPTIPGKAFAMRMKQLVDEMANKMRTLGYDINKVTEKNVQGLLDSAEAMEKQRIKAEALKKFPKETHKFFGRPLTEKDFKEIDKLYPPKETPGQFVRKQTIGTKEYYLEELKNAYPNEFKRLTGKETTENLKEMIKHLDEEGIPFASGGIAGELRLNRQGYAKGQEAVEEAIIHGPKKTGVQSIDKIIDAIGAGAGISTLGLPKWLLSKLTQGGVRSKLAKKYYQLMKENRLREARQLLTARDPYIGEDPEMSEAKRTMRKYTRRMPTEEEEEFRLSPEMIEEGWRYPGRGGRGVPHERTARNKRGYTSGGLVELLKL